jgi:hypothetical protein
LWNDLIVTQAQAPDERNLVFYDLHQNDFFTETLDVEAGCDLSLCIRKGDLHVVSGTCVLVFSRLV